MAAEREWDYWPEPEGEPYTDKDGNEVIGFHDRSEGQDELALLAEFEAYAHGLYGLGSLTFRPILARDASDVECRINGWEEGTFVRCTTRAKHPRPMWQIEIADTDKEAEHGE
jgi:hypothetical protein